MSAQKGMRTSTAIPPTCAKLEEPEDIASNTHSSKVMERSCSPPIMT
jgi:hypothetical protein